MFASLFALFLPAWLSRFALIQYANESATARLLIGGGLITLANVFVQIRAAQSTAFDPRSNQRRARDSKAELLAAEDGVPR